MKTILKASAAVVVVCAMGLLSTSAKADVQTIRNANNAYWGSIGAFQLNYKEPTTPIPNSQRGWVPSVAVGASYMGNSGLYLATEGSVSFGDDRYRGALYNSGTGEYDIPYEEDSHATVTTINGRIGKGFVIGQSTMITPYFDLGFRYWERDLTNMVEDYRNFEALGGLLLQYSPTNRLTFSAYGAAGSTFGAEMELDSTEYSLGSAAVYKVGGKIGYNLTEHFEVFTSLDYNHFHFVKSSVVNGAYEPSSSTNGTALRVGLAYHLK